MARRHLWFRFDEDEGLRVEPMRGQTVSVDGELFKSRREPLYMAHGSRLYVGKAQLRLRLFAGFEGTGYAPRRDGEAAGTDEQTQSPEQAQAAAMAQQQEGLVNVNLSDIVIQDIANNLSVEVEAVKDAVS